MVCSIYWTYTMRYYNLIFVDFHLWRLAIAILYKQSWLPLAASLLRMSLGSGGDAPFVSGVCWLLSVPLGEQASGRRWDCSGLWHVARRCFGTKWYDDMGGGGHGVPEMVTPAIRTTAVLLGFLNLTNMPCSVLPWQAAWQVILIS